MSANQQTIADEYAQLVAAVKTASDIYYNDPENVELSDAEFDAMYDRLIEIEAAHPDLANPHSPTQKVGGSATSLEAHQVRHTIPMLSLAKETTEEGVRKFLAQLPEDTKVMVQAKADGVSMSLTYKDGELVQAATRGDGRIGDDVTQTIAQLPSVPTQIKNGFTGVVRGEVVIHRAELPAGMKNPRNAAAGSVKHKDPAEAAKRNCRFYAFDVYEEGLGRAEYGQMELDDMGFKSVPSAVYSSDQVEDILNYLDILTTDRESLPYDCDGAVVKVCRHDIREQMGMRSNSPRWAFAYKVEGVTAQAKVIGFNAVARKSGQLGLRYQIEPVFLDGSDIENITAHNMSEVRRKDVRIGDVITIIKCGGVIPGVVCVTDPSKRDGSEQVIEAPIECPTCGGELETFGNSDQIKCVNPDCTSQVVDRLVHFASRKAMEQKGISEKNIRKWHEAGLLNTFADFYKLTAEDLAGFEGMKDKSINNALAAIETSKGRGLRRLWIGLGIPMASEGTAKRLCWHYDNLRDIMAAPASDLEEIDDIGPAVAANIVAFFARPEIAEMIDELEQLGVSFDRLDEDAPASGDAPLAGQTFVITGALSVSRSEFAKLLEAAGAKVSGSVSKNTTALITDDPTSNSGKAKKARDLGVQVISEDEARALMAG